MEKLSLTTKSELRPEEVLKKAKTIFKDEFELDILGESLSHVRLAGGGGYVYIKTEEQTSHTNVLLEGIGWDRQLRQLMEEITA